VESSRGGNLSELSAWLIDVMDIALVFFEGMLCVKLELTSTYFLMNFDARRILAQHKNDR
jgi:hypothetical protein